MELVLTSLIVCGTFAWCVKQITKLTPFAERYFKLQETKLAIQEQEVVRPSPPKPEPPPADLVQIALGEASAWAQEDALKRMYEIFADTQSWAATRERFMLEMSK